MRNTPDFAIDPKAAWTAFPPEWQTYADDKGRFTLYRPRAATNAAEPAIAAGSACTN
jgi:hypothetical protein